MIRRKNIDETPGIVVVLSSQKAVSSEPSVSLFCQNSFYYNFN
jgi:hypothetical protein